MYVNTKTKISDVYIYIHTYLNMIGVLKYTLYRVYFEKLKN